MSVVLQPYLLLVFTSTILQTWAYNSYIVVCPKSIRPGTDFTCKVTLLRSFRRLKVTSSIESENAPFVINSDPFIIPKGDREKLISVSLPFDLPSANDYTITVTAMNRQGKVEFQNSTHLTLTEKSVSVFIQTDKATYKPGQLVQFRCFATAPDLLPIVGNKDIDVTDPTDNRIFQWRDVDGPKGVFQGSLQLSNQLPLGNWKIKVSIRGTAEEKTFTVEEYVLPKFEVTISIPDFGLKTDKYLAGTVTALYTFGNPVVGKCLLTLKQKSFSVKGIQGYSLDLNITGKTPFEIERKELFDKLDIQMATPTLELEADVTEGLTGTVLSGTAEFTYYNRPEKLVFLDGNNNYKPGLKYVGYVFLSDQNDKPLGTQEYDLDIKVTFQSTTNEAIDGKVLNISNVKVPKNGIAKFTFKVPLQATSVMIEAKYDTLRPTKYLQPFQSTSKTYIQATVSPNKPKAGKIATFQIRSTTPGVTITYVIIARGKIIDCGKISMEGKYVFEKILITSEMAPTARFVVYYAKKNAEIIADSVSFNVQGIFENEVGLKFSRRSRKPGQNVTLIVNADPGSQCSVLTVDKSVLLLKEGNDITQKMVEDELSLYDSGPSINPCTPFRPCLRLFFPMPMPGLDASSIFRESGLIVLTDAFLYSSTPIWRGGGPILEFDGAPPEIKMKNSGGGGLESPRVRQFFPETWLFSNALADDEGKCKIKTIAPDTITTWVATAFALNDKTGLGVSPNAANLRTFLNFFIRLELPYCVIRGEQVILQATVFNFFKKQLQARVTLSESEDFQNILVSRNKRGKPYLRYKNQDVTQTVKIPAKSGVAVKFPIRPTKIGNIELNVKAVSSLASDAVKRTLLIKAEGIPESYNIARLVQIREWEKQFTFEEEITFPDNLVPDSQSIRVSALGDLMGPTLNGLTNLLQMPYGCGEQNMITFAPNVYVIRYLNITSNLQSDVLSTGQANMLGGYQRQMTYQLFDGSFSAFGNNDPSGSTWLTAFVVKSFAQAKSYIFIDNKLMRNAISWILDRFDDELGIFDEPGRVIHTEMQGGSGTDEGSLTAFTLTALLEATNNGFGSGNPFKLVNTINAATTSLENSIADITKPYVLCIVSYALALAGSNKTHQVLEMLEDIAVYEDGTMYWEIEDDPDDSNLRWKPPYVQAKSRSIEATSYVLLTYAKLNDITNGLKIVKWLVKQRNTNGGFGSTQDTVVALQALSEFAALVYTPDFDLVITILGKPVGFGHLFLVNIKNALLFQSVDLPKGVRSVQVVAKGKGMALVEIGVRYNVYEELTKPSIGLDVSYTNETIKGFKLKVCYRWLGKGKSSMALMEISLLSGFEPAGFKVTDIKSFQRPEYQSDKMVLYFNEITTTRECVTVTMERNGLVYGSQSQPIVMYDYYQQDKKAKTLYLPNLLSDTNVCATGADIKGCE